MSQWWFIHSVSPGSTKHPLWQLYCVALHWARTTSWRSSEGGRPWINRTTQYPFRKTPCDYSTDRETTAPGSELVAARNPLETMKNANQYISPLATGKPGSISTATALEHGSAHHKKQSINKRSKTENISCLTSNPFRPVSHTRTRSKKWCSTMQRRRRPAVEVGTTFKKTNITYRFRMAKITFIIQCNRISVWYFFLHIFAFNFQFSSCRIGSSAEDNGGRRMKKICQQSGKIYNRCSKWRQHYWVMNSPISNWKMLK